MNSAYPWLLNPGGISYSWDWRCVWKLDVLPRIQYFGWLLVHDRLPTSEVLRKRGCIQSSICPLCCAHVENFLYALHDCQFASIVWLQLGVVAKDKYFFDYDCKGWLAVNLKGKTQVNLDNSFAGMDWKVVFLVGCWFFWKWRCKCLFEAKFKLPLTPAAHIWHYASNMVSSVQAARNGVRKMQSLIF